KSIVNSAIWSSSCSILSAITDRFVSCECSEAIPLNKSCCRPCHCGLPGARQADCEFGELAGPAVDSNRAAMPLRDDVVADRQAQPGALAGRLCREEGLEEFVPELGCDAGAIVAHPDLDLLAELARRHLEARLELRVAPVVTAFVGRVEAVAEQVEQDAGHFL